MNLIELKQYMQQVKMTTFAHLCQKTKMEADTLRCMLSHWIKKGKIRQCTSQSACGSTCFKCPMATTAETYEWVTDSITMI